MLCRPQSRILCAETSPLGVQLFLHTKSNFLLL
uniref:Uncharacterized protein n=1 Tax=Rhizophora mucronata TaxID=61149 RepID=A0A2P2N3F1_RHIMU